MRKQRKKPAGAATATPMTAAEAVIATLIGHGIETQMVMNVALAAMAVNRGKMFPPCGGASFERPMDGALKQVVVTGVGHWRGEGLALVERIG